MLIGAQIHSNATTWAEAARIAALMDAGPWHSVWVPDHFVPPLAFLDEAGPCLEGWSMLAGFAATTASLEMGVLVTGNTYRNPALLAKMAATVDEMSGGRLILGIGAAWHAREHEAYGFEFPSIKERCDRLEEACLVIRQLFTADAPVDFSGRYYRLTRAPFAPRSAREGHIPIMVGGNGEKRTLKTLAKHGDVMNLDEGERQMAVPVGLQEDERKAERLRELWGNRYAPEERKKILAIGSAEHIVEVVQSYRAAGIEHVIFKGMPNNGGLYQRLAEEVLPALVA